MSNMKLILKLSAVLALIFTASSLAQSNLSNYIRAREFALRFANVIAVNGLNYTIGRNNDDPKRLMVTSGSRDAYVGGAGGQLVRLSRAAKVDNRGLLIPANALRYLGCTVATQAASILVTCDGKSYALQAFKD
jgi:hypothetical protein